MHQPLRTWHKAHCSAADPKELLAHEVEARDAALQVQVVAQGMHVLIGKCLALRASSAMLEHAIKPLSCAQCIIHAGTTLLRIEGHIAGGAEVTMARLR